jgi:molybdopterin-guanine dinucleotide biosynthesis protein MobB
MVELAVVGSKNSGKTTVIEGLTGYLVGEGYRVATIKHTSHSHRFDKPGKDTYRHRQAGAMLTVAVSKGETAIFAESDSIDIRHIQDITRQPIDIWLIEGDRNAERPKVLVTRQLKELSGELPENIFATIGPERLDDVPAHFEGEDYKGLGSFVINSMTEKKTEIQE